MSETNMKVCNNYFLVDPTKASFLDLLLLLFSSNLTNARFIDSPPDTLRSFRRTFTSRWIIALAIFLQKVLMLIRKPMAILGGFLTYCLNLVTANGGFFKMILNLLTGEKSNNITYFNLLRLLFTINYTKFLNLDQRRFQFFSFFYI